MEQHSDKQLLFNSLQGLLAGEGVLMEVLSRDPFIEASTYPIELVKCRMHDGRVLDLFCKFLGKGGFSDFGHRGGLLYEAHCYDSILNTFPYTKVKYYGIRQLKGGGDIVMVLDYLGNYLRFVKTADPVTALQKAARWAGKFHAFGKDRRADFLNRYGEAYYHQWLRHFTEICEPLLPEYPFLSEVISFYGDNLHVLLDGPQTIIHGEYYPRNVLMKDGEIYPVDWESAAWGPGEVDLATLIEDWDPEAIRKAKEAYVQARWPNGNYSTMEFERRLIMAKLYLFARFCPWKKNNRTEWIRNKSIYKYLLQIIGEAQEILGAPSRSVII